MAPGRDGQVVGTIAVRLEAPRHTRLGWQPGPLPLPWGEQYTDAKLRSSYLATRARHLLYEPPQRWHRIPEDPLVYRSGESSVRIDALELLEVSFGSGPSTVLGIAHVDASGVDPITALSEMVRPPDFGAGQTWLGLESSALWGTPAANRGLRTGSALLSMAGASGHDDAAERALHAASLNPGAVAPIHDGSPLTRLSPAWLMVVLRDGVGFAWESDRDDPFLARARTLVRSVYTDIVLLAHVQRAELEAVADALAVLDHRSECAAQLAALADRFSSFRNQLWWDDVSAHERANSLMSSCQQQLRTPDLFERVGGELRELRSIVDTSIAERLRRQQEDMARRQSKFQETVKTFAGAYAGASLTLALMSLADVSVAEATVWSVLGGLVGALCVGGGGWMIRWIINRSTVNHSSDTASTPAAAPSHTDRSSE